MQHYKNSITLCMWWLQSLIHVRLLYMFLFQFEVHPYVHSYLYYKYFSSGWLITKISDMLNKNSPGLLKKGAAKQSRIKSIAWHLRWLVRTRADIGLRPSGLVRSRTDIKLRPSELVRSRTDIKLRPSAFVRTRTDFKLQTVRLVRSCKDWYKSKYTHKSF